MIIDFRRKSAVLPKLSINGTEVDRVEEYKNLGTGLVNKVNVTAKTNFIYKICQSRLYCLLKPKHLGVNTTVLKAVYRSNIECVLSFSFLTCLNLGEKKEDVLNRVVNQCDKVLNESKKV